MAKPVARPRTLYVKPAHVEYWTRIDDYAAHLGISVSTVVAWALSEWLAKADAGVVVGPPPTSLRLSRLPTPDQK